MEDLFTHEQVEDVKSFLGFLLDNVDICVMFLANEYLNLQKFQKKPKNQSTSQGLFLSFV